MYICLVVWLPSLVPCVQCTIAGRFGLDTESKGEGDARYVIVKYSTDAEMCVRSRTHTGRTRVCPPLYVLMLFLWVRVQPGDFSARCVRH